MKTLRTASAVVAAQFIRRGNVVGFPTETVYGLGANAYDEKAVKKIFMLKGRPSDNPLIVHVAYKKDINILAESVPEYAIRIIDSFFPGPVTVVLKKSDIISGLVTAELDTIAVRMPSSAIARKFIRLCGVPIAAPSANLSGSPSPTDAEHVIADFSGNIPCILKGPKSMHGLESTVVDCTGKHPVILRPGVVTLEQLRKIDKHTKVLKSSKKIKSPGQKYRHYAPKAKVKLISDFGFKIADLKRQTSNVKRQTSNVKRQTIAYIGLNRKIAKNLEVARICRTLEEYAKNLFSFFRECDRMGIKTIYCDKVNEKGIGLAIMNRIKKARRKA